MQWSMRRDYQGFPEGIGGQQGADEGSGECKRSGDFRMRQVQTMMGGQLVLCHTRLPEVLAKVKYHPHCSMGFVGLGVAANLLEIESWRMYPLDRRDHGAYDVGLLVLGDRA